MKLTKVDIRNFRSIEGLALPFAQRCQVLVGINESGKTNILRALRLLGTQFALKKDEIRQTRSDQNEISESRVLFEFVLENADVKQAIKKLHSQVLIADWATDSITFKKQNCS